MCSFALIIYALFSLCSIGKVSGIMRKLWCVLFFLCFEIYLVWFSLILFDISWQIWIKFWFLNIYSLLYLSVIQHKTQMVSFMLMSLHLINEVLTTIYLNFVMHGFWQILYMCVVKACSIWTSYPLLKYAHIYCEGSLCVAVRAYFAPWYPFREVLCQDRINKIVIQFYFQNAPKWESSSSAETNNRTLSSMQWYQQYISVFSLFPTFHVFTLWSSLFICQIYKKIICCSVLL